MTTLTSFFAFVAYSTICFFLNRYRVGYVRERLSIEGEECPMGPKVIFLLLD